MRFARCGAARATRVVGWLAGFSLTLLLPVAGASASPVTRAAFTDRAKVESFENEHRPVTPSASFNLPIPTLFPSGVRIIGPAPNRGDSFGPFVVDDFGFFGLGERQFVPDGTAYLGQANPNLLTRPIVFSFATPQFRVGAYVAVATPDSPSSEVTMTAYDRDGRPLESVVSRGVQPADWANNFVGIERAEGISQLWISSADGGGVLRLDELTFEPVPLPAGGFAGLVAMPVVVVVANGSRWRRRQL